MEVWTPAFGGKPETVSMRWVRGPRPLLSSWYDRANFARNSKALYGWTRAQINLTPFNEDNNDTLIVASGKCNNAQEFEPFTIELDTDSMTYSRVEAGIEEWKERVNTGGSSKKAFGIHTLSITVSRAIDTDGTKYHGITVFIYTVILILFRIRSHGFSLTVILP